MDDDIPDFIKEKLIKNKNNDFKKFDEDEMNILFGIVFGIVIATIVAIIITT